MEDKGIGAGWRVNMEMKLRRFGVSPGCPINFSCQQDKVNSFVLASVSSPTE